MEGGSLDVLISSSKRVLYYCALSQVAETEEQWLWEVAVRRDLRGQGYLLSNDTERVWTEKFPDCKT